MNEQPQLAAIDVGGAWYMRDHKGALVPVAAVKARDLLMDEVTRDLVARARKLSADMAAFKLDALERISAHQALLAQEYDATVGGPKGNVALVTFDGCERVTIQVADRTEFGPELQIAKTIIDECVNEWAATGRPELRAIVARVFQTDKQGQVSTAQVLSLLRTEITDPRWLRAMEAIRDSMRTSGSARYVRFYERDAGDAAWSAVSLDLAKL